MSEQSLPMAGSGTNGAPPASPMPPSTSAARLIATLAVAGALAGFAIVLVFQWASPRIEAYKARVLAEAITEVLGGPERWETLFLDGGTFTAEPRTDTAGLDRIYVGYDAQDAPMGIAITAAEPGFQDVITLIFGYDPGEGDLLGMKVLDNKETPGLGDKIVKDSAFVQAFRDVGSPLVGVKKGRAEGAHEEVVMITGATISSRAVIDIINHRLEALKEPVDTYWSTTRQADVTTAAPAAPAGATPGGGA
jgi:electron transport complex protein RnfG